MKIRSITITILVLFVLIGCPTPITEPTDADLVATAKTALNIGYADGDDIDGVTQTVTLPATVDSAPGVTITWSSDNTAVITAAGAVTRPASASGDATVVLTATITKGLENDTKEFSLTVLKEETTGPTDADLVAAAKTALAIIYGSGDSNIGVTQDLTLPTTVTTAPGVTITWSSDNTAIDAATGAVTRPFNGTGNAAVLLTATISKGSESDIKDFNLTVLEKGATGPTDAQLVAAAKAALAIGYGGSDNANSVTQDLTLPATGDGGTTIAWSSDNTAIDAATGAVTRPSASSSDASVTLTATITKESATDTKTFVLTVPKEEPTDIGTLGDFTIDVDNKTAETHTTGSHSVTVNGGLSPGNDYTLSITDPLSITNAGAISIPNTYASSDTYTITVTAVGIGNYSGTKEKTFTLTVVLSDADAVADALSALDITAAVGGNLQAVTNSFTLPTAGEEGTSISWEVLSGSAITLSGSNNEDAAVTRPSFTATDDDVLIKATVTKNGETDTKTFNLKVLKASSLSDAESVAQAKADLDIAGLGFVSGDTFDSVTQDFTLPTTGSEGTSISWNVVSGSAIVLSGSNNEDAAVTRPSFTATDDDVVLKATFTKNGETDSNTFNLKVLKADSLSDTESVNQAKDDLDIAGLGFALGDTFDSVTQDFTLPTTGSEGTTISWEVVSGSGISLSGSSNKDASVSRPDYTDGDSNVKLRATYSKNGATASEEFDLTVLKKDQVPLTASLTGSISPISIPAGSDSTKTLTFTGASQSLIIGTDIEVRIKTRPNTAAEAHLSLGVNTGVLFPSTDIIPRDSGDYTIELSGIGNYTGTLDRTLNLTVTALAINSITYTAINAETSSALTAAAAPTVDPAEAAAGALFDIDTGFTSETGLSFNTGTGAISGTATAVIDKSYTVSITGGDATKYEGSTQSTSIQVKVTLSDADAVANALSALDITTTVGGNLQAVTGSFALPATGEEGTSISWEVVSGSAIDLSGTNNENAAVTRPSFTATDDDVVIKATVTKNGETDTKTFNLKVLKASSLSDAESVAQAKADLDTASFGFASGDAFDSITQDFTLPTIGSDGVSISWNVVSGSAIDLSGTNNKDAAVTRPSFTATDDNVLIEATFTKNGETDTKTFNLKVLKASSLSDAESVAQAKDDLDIASLGFASGDSYDSVTQDFTLPTTGTEGTTISWNVVSGSAIDLSGSNNEDAAVTRPSFTAADDDVVLEATFTKNGETDSKTFNLNVPKAESLNDAESVNQAKDDLDIAGLGFALGDTFDSVTQDFTLPTTGSEGTTISWEVVSGSGISLSGSSNKDASVSRPDYTDGDSNVKLRATYSKNGATASEEFDLTVLKKDQIPLTASLTGSISPITIPAGSDSTETLVFSGGSQSLIIGTDIEVRIKTRPNTAAEAHLSMGVNTGVLFPSTDIIPRDGGDYIIELSGIGNYTGTLDRTLNLTVTALAINSITYTAINTETSTALTAAAVPTVDPAEAATGALFDIDTGFTTETGLSFDTGTGAISGTASAVIDKSYTVSITGGDGTKYEGSTQSTSIQVRVTLSDADSVADALSALDITAAVGGNLQAVTSSFALPTAGEEGTSISWEVLSGSAITLSGSNNEDAAVTRPSFTAADDDVLIKATVTKNGETDTKTFNLKVLKASSLSDAESVAQAKADLDIAGLGFVSGDTFDSVTQDFTLPTTGSEGTTISWEVVSGSAIVLSGSNNEDAAVTRPSFTATDDDVVLKATFTKNGETDSNTFNLKVLKADSLSDTESVNQAKDDLDIAGLGFALGDTFDSVTQDFTLPTTGSEGTTISWEVVSGSGISLSGSSNKDASVSRPNYMDGDSNVKLRATYSKNGATASEEFDLTVLKKDQVPLTASLTGSISPITIPAGSDSTKTLTFTGASQSLIIGTDIEVRIKTRPNTAAEAHLSMGVNTGVLFPSTDIIPRDSGDYTIELSGIGNYTGTLDRTLNLTVTALAINSITYTAINTETSTALTAAAVPTVDPAEAAAGALFNIDTGFTTETGLSFNTGTGAISGTASTVIDKSYTVSITGGDATKYEGSTQSTSIQVRVTLSDADAVARAKNDLETTGLGFAGSDTWDGITQDFTLPVSIGTDGVTISWEVVSGSGIVLSGNSNQDASVSRPDYTDGDSNVKLRATYSKNGATASEEFDLTVLKKDQVPLTASLTGSISPITIPAGSNSTETLVFSGGSQSLIIGTDIEVRIKTRPNTAAEAHLSLGVNTGVLFPSTGIIPNDSGDYTIELSGIGNYTGTLDRTLNLTVTALGINSITYTAINAETSTALTAAAVPTVDPSEAATGALFDIDTGFTTETGLSFDTGTGAISGTASAVIDKSYTVSITGGDGTKYEGSTQSTSIQVRVTLSDADAVARAKNDLEATGLGFAGSDTWDGITQDFTLPVSIGTDGVTISWEVVSGSGIVLSGSSNKDASVSRPDYTDGDSNVKLRATYSKNGATASEEFDLTVLKKDQVPLTASLTGSISPITIPAGSNSTETLVFSGGSQSLIIGTDIEVRIKTRPNTAAEAHLSLGVNTGVIFPSTGIIPNDSGDYIIELRGIGNYTGTLDRTLSLTVTALPINSISYTAINAETSTALTAAAVPTVDPAEAATGALFDIDTGFMAETGLSFNTGTGAISGTASAVIDKSYTVSITGGDGTKYEGSTQSTSIQVRVTLSDADAVARAKNDLEATGLGFAGSDTWDGITQDFTLPVSIGTDGVTISWEVVSGSGIVLSGNSNQDASVSRPDYTDGDSNVKLRATYSKNGATASEEFDLTVLKKDQVPLTASLTGSISPITIPAGSDSTKTLTFTGASQSLIIGTDIEVRIKTRPNTAAEAHLSLGVNTGVLFPSTDIIPRDSGDYTIELSGIGNYTGTLDRTLNLTVTALGINSITYTAINAETSTALTAAAVPTVDPAEAATGALFDIDTGFTSETGLSFNTGTGAISGTATAVIDKSYTVSITGGDATKYEGSTQSTSIQVKVTLSDADAVARAKNDLEATGLGFAGSDTWDGITQDFTLPVSIGTDGVTISWEVVSGSGISLSGSSNKDASVSRPDYMDGDSNVKLRATYSKNGATASEEFDLTVLKKDQVPLTASLTGSISPISIPAGSDSTETLVFSGGSQSLIIGTDIEVRIKTRPNTAAEAHLSLGVNTGVLFPSTGIIPNDSGDYTIELSGIGNYTGTLDRTLNLTVTALGINSITYTAINAETSTALTAAAVPTVDPSEAATGALFDIDTGFTTETGLSFNTGTGAISGTASAVIDKSYTVSITGGDGTKYEGSTQSTSIQVRVTLSDADSVAAAKAALVITDITFASGEDKDSVTQDVTLPASGEEATTIAWSSDNTAIDATGTVTRPSASSSDATVTLTATISKGSASDTKTFVLTVLKEEPIDIGTLGSFTIDVDAATAKTNTESSHSATVNGGLTAGIDYTLTITGPLTITNGGVITIPDTYTSVGTHTITVTAVGTGNYSGTKAATFTLTVGYSDAELVAQAKTDLAITYAVGDSASAVTQDLTLPTTGTGGTTIAWSSNNTAVITAAGVVTRPSAASSSTLAILTATISKGSASDTKTFVLTVLKEEPIDIGTLGSFTITVANKTVETNSTSTDTHSVTIGGGLAAVTDYTLGITAPLVITDAGAISIFPNSYTSVGTHTITVTATGRGNYTGTKTATFTLTVVLSDADAVAAAKTALDITDITFAAGEDASKVIQDITLPTAGTDGTSITWSSNYAAIAVAGTDGTVTRPDASSNDVSVTLTATITKDSATATKDFTLTVIKMQIGDMFSYDNAPDGDVTINDVLSNYGVTITEGTHDNIKSSWLALVDPKDEQASLKVGTATMTEGGTWDLVDNTADGVFLEYTFSRPVSVRSLLIAPRSEFFAVRIERVSIALYDNNDNVLMRFDNGNPLTTLTKNPAGAIWTATGNIDNDNYAGYKHDLTNPIGGVYTLKVLLNKDITATDSTEYVQFNYFNVGLEF